MKKKALLWIIGCLVIALSGLVIFSFARDASEVKRADAARIILDRICLLIEPPLEEFPEDERYEVLASALASRGITNFLGTDPDETLTVGDMEEIFNAISLGEPVEYGEERAECPAEITEIFAMDPSAKLTLGDFRKIADCFPYCEWGAETYIAPAALFTPGGREPEDEEPSHEL